MIVKVVLLFVLTVLSNIANAKIYKWVDEDGQTHFSQDKPSNSKTKVLISNVHKSQSLKSYLYPFGYASVLKASKNTYCNKDAALDLLRKNTLRKKQDLSDLKQQTKKTEYKLHDDRVKAQIEIQKEQSALEEYKHTASNSQSENIYLLGMQNKCQQLKKDNIRDLEVYDIERSGYMLVFNKEDREYIDYIGIGLKKYPSDREAKLAWLTWTNKKNTSKYSRVEQDKISGLNVLLMDDMATFSVAFILVGDVIIEIQFAGKKFAEFKQLQYFVKRYVSWLSTKV